MNGGAPGSPPCVLTINGGSSSIKFALFEIGEPARRLWTGKVEGIGQPQGRLVVKGARESEDLSQPAAVADHTAAVTVLMDWMEQRLSPGQLAAVGHRVVHGGPNYWEPQIITPALISELHHLSPFDPEHLPEEILLTEAFHRRFAHVPQIACFDTAFHHDLPAVARLLPIPRRYAAVGVRRYGFHGLSCSFLMEELARTAGPAAARGRVVLAHLGNGASITAVLQGKSIDTTMSFTPAAGLPMSTRSGDLDPGLAWYLARAEQVSASQFHHMINHESGLLGISETSSDMRELVAREKEDVRAAEAVALFCYQAKKFVCAMAGALAGLDTLVFSGGIGENAAEVRERICSGLDFLGVEVAPEKNAAGAGLISKAGAAVAVRVIRTDEESIIAKMACAVLTAMRKK
jgi:acetate kinase